MQEDVHWEEISYFDQDGPSAPHWLLIQTIVGFAYAKYAMVQAHLQIQSLIV